MIDKTKDALELSDSETLVISLNSSLHNLALMINPVPWLLKKCSKGKNDLSSEFDQRDGKI